MSDCSVFQQYCTPWPVLDESKPSPLQRRALKEHLERRARLQGKIKPIISVDKKEPAAPEIYAHPGVFWGLTRAWDISIPRPATESEATENPPATYSVRDIKRAVCLCANVSQNDLISGRRTKRVMNPRHVAVCLSRRFSFLSLPAIARSFGGRDHTTLLSSIRKMTPVMERIEWMTESSTLPQIVKAAMAVCNELFPIKNPECGKKRYRLKGRLTDDEVMAIRRAPKSMWPHFAEKHGLKVETVRRVNRREMYKFISSETCC